MRTAVRQWINKSLCMYCRRLNNGEWGAFSRLNERRGAGDNGPRNEIINKVNRKRLEQRNKPFRFITRASGFALEFACIVESKFDHFPFTCARGTGGCWWHWNFRGRNCSNPLSTWCLVEATVEESFPSEPRIREARRMATHLRVQQIVRHDMTRAVRGL